MKTKTISIVFALFALAGCGTTAYERMRNCERIVEAQVGLLGVDSPAQRLALLNGCMKKYPYHW